MRRRAWAGVSGRLSLLRLHYRERHFALEPELAHGLGAIRSFIPIQFLALGVPDDNLLRSDLDLDRVAVARHCTGGQFYLKGLALAVHRGSAFQASKVERVLDPVRR